MSVIEVDNLHKRYGEHVAVQDVSFAVEEGEIFGILGPNGAGKTTTVECVEGLRERDGGTVRVLGHDPATDPAALRELLGAQLQEAELPDRLRVGEALDLFASFYRAPADTRELTAALGLDGLEDRPFAKLSGGQRQKLSIALSLVGNPRVAVLDELTTGLDPAARRDTWALIERVRERGVTIMLVTHSMEEAERLCDRVAVVDARPRRRARHAGRARLRGAGGSGAALRAAARRGRPAPRGPAAGHRRPPRGRRGRRRRQRGRPRRGHRGARPRRHLPRATCAWSRPPWRTRSSP